MTSNRRACMLAINPCEPRTLAEAVHCVARHSGVDTHGLADALEVDYATFVRWTAPYGQSQLPGRKFAVLAQETGRVDHIAWIARDAGMMIVPRVGGGHFDELLETCEQAGRLAAECRRL
jgi:hypothetical protein